MFLNAACGAVATNRARVVALCDWRGEKRLPPDVRSAGFTSRYL